MASTKETTLNADGGRFGDHQTNCSANAILDPGVAIQGPNHEQAVLEPENLLCALTQIMYRDPVVVAGSGNTYEREAVLAHWQHRGQAHDPLTNLNLANNVLITNWDKRRDVQHFLTVHANYIPEGWESREVLPPSLQERPHIARRGSASIRYDIVVFMAVAICGIAVGCGAWELCRIPLLVWVMRQAPHDPIVQVHCCKWLADLASSGTKHQNSIAQSGGIKVIVSALRAHSENPELQESACRALTYVAWTSARLAGRSAWSFLDNTALGDLESLCGLLFQEAPHEEGDLQQMRHSNGDPYDYIDGEDEGEDVSTWIRTPLDSRGRPLGNFREYEANPLSRSHFDIDEAPLEEGGYLEDEYYDDSDHDDSDAFYETQYRRKKTKRTQQRKVKRAKEALHFDDSGIEEHWSRTQRKKAQRGQQKKAKRSQAHRRRYD